MGYFQTPWRHVSNSHTQERKVAMRPLGIDGVTKSYMQAHFVA